MIRVLYVSTSTTIGGAEKTLFTLATSLDRKAFEVAGVVSVKPKGRFADSLERAGCPTFTLDNPGAPGLGTIRKLSAIIRETRPRIVHALMYKAIQLTRAAKWFDGQDVKLLSSPRVHYRTRSAASLLIDRLLKSADDALVTESDASRSYLVNRLGYDGKKVVMIRNGIDLSKLTFSSEGRERVRRELGLGRDDILVGAVGRLDAQKGHAYLLEAIAKLRAIHPVRGVIIGAGPAAGALEKLTRHLRIEDHVRFAGEQADIVPWLSAMDIFVQPSLWEGLPNALLEAMGLGLPVVATHVDGIPEVVRDGTTGILCDAKDSQALHDAIQYLILDPGLRQRLAAAGREEMQARFKLPDMIAAYERLYRKLAEPK